MNQTEIYDIFASNKVFRELFEVNPHPMMVHDVESLKFLAVNGAAIAHYGYSRKEFLSMTLRDIQPPADIERLEKYLAQVKDKVTAENAGVWQHLKKDGALIHVQITWHSILFDQCPARLVLVHDITGQILANRALINAVSTMGALRDPYTAGHQQRVGKLAVAIAQEMVMPSIMVDGLKVMGELHDIGKIGVPAEILVKPAKLTDAEYTIVRTHAQLSYDILKGIDFEWPVSKAILQHHERLNGSGYPNGIVGDEIIPEARILAVADVVESMASHRPYRAALGIDAALHEIEQNMDVLYDGDAARACLLMFRDKGYRLN